VNYNIQTKTVTEWNVGCEKCHGPGSEHLRRHSRETIVNPARLDTIHATDVCIQCHSQGQPLANPFNGKYYDWPVGFQVGMNLRDYWKLEEHKLGEQSFTHFTDGTAHKNRMQGNFCTEPDVHARCELLHVSRRPRYTQQCGPPDAGQGAVPAVPQSGLTSRPACSDHRSAYAPPEYQRRKRVCRLPH